MTETKKDFGARVFLRWLAALPKPIPCPRSWRRCRSRRSRPEALQCLEGEESKDNEITIIVSSYDFDADKDVTLFVKGAAPGKYALAKARATLPQQGGTNVPKDD
jgi:hypothetical protein